MTTYNTKNPVPSSDARDRYDNSQVFDELMNGAAPNTPDRLGVLRQSWAGMETEFQMFLANSGLESTHLTYVDGTPLVASRPTQLIDRAGSIYRVKLPASFPVTLTGMWETDQNLLVDVGDAALRASLAASSGSDMVGFTQAGTGAVTRTVQSKMRDTVSVKDFGAVGDGVTDDTAAFNAAVAYANSRGNNDAVGTAGTTIFIPDGRYKIGPLSVITKSGCEFVGASINGTVLLLKSNVGSIFQWGNGTDYIIGGGIRSLKLEYLLQPGLSDSVVTFKLTYRTNFCDLILVNTGTFMVLGTSPTTSAGDITVNRVKGYMANIGIPLFKIISGAGLFIDNMNVFVGGVLHPIHPALMTTVPNCNVFNCFYGNWDTVLVSNCTFERFYQCLAISASSGMVYQNFHFTKTIIDYHKSYVVYAFSDLGGIVNGIRFDATCWFVSWEADAIYLGGAGYSDDHYFAGRVVTAGLSAVNYSLANAKNVVFDGLLISATNRNGAGVASLAFAANSSGFTVDGCHGNTDTTGVGFPWRSPFGISVAGNCQDFSVLNNRLVGSVAGYSIAANSAASVSRRVAGNANANYAGVSAGLALAASGVGTYNTTSTVVDVYIYGGTVSGINVNGVGIGGATSGCFTIEPGQYIAVSYSAAPSFTSIVKA